MAEARSPDDEVDAEKANGDQFVVQTKSIFNNFLYERLTSQIEEEASEGNMSVGEISKPVMQPLIEESSSHRGSSQDKMIGKTLAEMGDVLSKKYHEEFVDMARNLGLTSTTAYSTFAKIANRLFLNGINWGRIVALLLFGYEIAVSLIKKKAMGVRNFLTKIVNFVVQFIVKEKIADWIRDQGGWLVILDPRQHDQDLWIKRLLVGSAIAAIFYFAILKLNPSN